MRRYLCICTFIASAGFTPWLHACNDLQIHKDQAPARSIQNTLEKISAFHHSADANTPQAIDDFITDEIMPCIALAPMAHWIAGPYARYMSTDDKAHFISQLETQLFNSLTKLLKHLNLDEYRVEIRRTRFTREDQAVVTVQVDHNRQRPVRLNFRMQLDQQRWKVADISSNGTSLVLYYRSRFIKQLRAFRNSEINDGHPAVHSMQAHEP